jgi:hypothetical protein
MQDSVRAGREATPRKKKFLYVGPSQFTEEDLAWKTIVSAARVRVGAYIIVLLSFY